MSMSEQEKDPNLKYLNICDKFGKCECPNGTDKECVPFGKGKRCVPNSGICNLNNKEVNYFHGKMCVDCYENDHCKDGKICHGSICMNKKDIQKPKDKICSNDWQCEEWNDNEEIEYACEKDTSEDCLGKWTPLTSRFLNSKLNKILYKK